MTSMSETINQYPTRIRRNEKRDDDLLLAERDVGSTPCGTSSTDDCSSSYSYLEETNRPRDRYMHHNSQNRRIVDKHEMSINTEENDDCVVESTQNKISPLNSPGKKISPKYYERNSSQTNGFMRIKTLRSATTLNSVTSIVTFESRTSTETESTRKHRNTHRYASIHNKKTAGSRHDYAQSQFDNHHHTPMISIEETNPNNAANYQRPSVLSSLYPPTQLTLTQSPQNLDQKNRKSIGNNSGTRRRMSGKKEQRSKMNFSRLKEPRKSEIDNQKNILERSNRKGLSPRVRRNRKNRSLQDTKVVQSNQVMSPPADFWSEYFPGFMCCAATSMTMSPNDILDQTQLVENPSAGTGDDAIVLQEIKKKCAEKNTFKSKDIFISGAKSLIDVNAIVTDLAESERIGLKHTKVEHDILDKQEIFEENSATPNTAQELSHEFEERSSDVEICDGKATNDIDCMSYCVEACVKSDQSQIQKENNSFKQHTTCDYEDKLIDSKTAKMKLISGPALGTFYNDIKSVDNIDSNFKSPLLSEFVGTYGTYRMDSKFADEIIKDMVCTVPLFHSVLKVRGENENESMNEVDRNISNISMCSEILASSFNVRGPTYKTNEKKIPSEESMFGLLGIDFFRSKGNNDDNRHMCGKKNSFYFRLKNLCYHKRYSMPFLFVVNFVTPFGNLIAYFHRPDSNGKPVNIELQNKPAEKLWIQFLEGDENFRNKRLKFIPSIHAGPWMVKKLVGSKPALIAQRIPTTYYGSREDNYLEVCFDVTKGGSVANSICSTCAGKSDIITVDLGFLIEGLETKELPEQILASLRLHHIRVKKCPTLDEWNEELKKKASHS